MLGFLRGTILHSSPPNLILEVHGVGYELTLPVTCFLSLGKPNDTAEIYVHTSVREDDISLYGFTHLEQRSLFRQLLKVNGIGAKMAIAILSSMSSDEFIQCVASQNLELLTQLPGIGKKTAQRLLLDLQDKLAEPVATAANAINPLKDQAIQALVSLGYKPSEAQTMVKQVQTTQLEVSEIIRQALATSR